MTYNHPCARETSLTFIGFAFPTQAKKAKTH